MMVTTKGTIHEVMGPSAVSIWLLEELFRQRHCGFPNLVHYIFRTILQLVEFFRRQSFFGRNVAKFFRPLRVYVKATRRLSERIGKAGLSFLRKHPVQEHLSSVRMSRISKHRNIATAARRIEPLFEI